jgi:hypothetical protein
MGVTMWMGRRLFYSLRSAAPLLASIIMGLAAAPLWAGTEPPGALPSLNAKLSPLAEENLPILFDRLVAAFASDYGSYVKSNQGRDLSDGMTIYYVRQELQALTDMWWATGDRVYLDLAEKLTSQASAAAGERSRRLLWYGQSRGDWPCFYLDTVELQTGGHSQLCDFQGCAGFMNVASILHQVGRPEWKPIADFVEHQVIEKWLSYKPTITKEDLTGPQSFDYLLAALNGARDVREHFACICLDLYGLGYRGYPYDKWARQLINLYLTERYDPDQSPPGGSVSSSHIPANWGLFVCSTSEGEIWLSIPNYDPAEWSQPTDTSHANRAAWLAAKAYADGFVDRDVVEGLVGTFRCQIWAPEKGPFYFNNYVDGSDEEIDGLSAGRAGNVWFGWHRLAAYDETLRDLFLSLAYDLTSGGENLPYGAQNKTMLNARTCLEAWAARLLAEKGHPLEVP